MVVNARSYSRRGMICGKISLYASHLSLFEFFRFYVIDDGACWKTWNLIIFKQNIQSWSFLFYFHKVGTLTDQICLELSCFFLFCSLLLIALPQLCGWSWNHCGRSYKWCHSWIGFLNWKTWTCNLLLTVYWPLHKMRGWWSLCPPHHLLK